MNLADMVNNTASTVLQQTKQAAPAPQAAAPATPPAPAAIAAPAAPTDEYTQAWNDPPAGVGSAGIASGLLQATGQHDPAQGAPVHPMGATAAPAPVAHAAHVGNPRDYEAAWKHLD